MPLFANAMDPPLSPTPPSPSPNATHRPPSATMRTTHSRAQSRMSTSRVSDDEASRTAVKVAVRVRPPLKASDPGFDLIPQRFRESTCDVPTPNSLSVQSPQGKKLFVFDRVFDESTTQEGVWEYVSDGVASFVKGYNVSILAYGQSGAGKSYTMGTAASEQSEAEVKGIVPRAAEALFDKLNGGQGPARASGLQTPKRYSTQALSTYGATQKANSAAKNWELRASYVEIYNEQLRDLLIPESLPQGERGQVAIREDTKGRIMLTGLTQVPVNSVEDMLNALHFGSQIRQTDATAINARSSRSHAVFSLNLIQRKQADANLTSKQDKRKSVPITETNGGDSVVTLDSKLHFVDLAGSERLKNTGATGERAKEGISINAGLASLGKVISQLSAKGGSGHISYRDSRLTRLLQDSLGGNAITFMVACVTPAVFHLSETLNTVTYAQRARAIQSRPEIQQSHEETDKQAAIDRLRAEVSFLRDQLRHSEHNSGRALDGNDRGGDRSRGREHELQSQLMDVQEHYNALSQRHAKLIAEITKSRSGEDGDTPILNEAIGENASERIQRSNSFAEAVEQVVLEYEKTIQSLETSLSRTRSSLSTTESTLMEKETRLAYMDTMQKQLQTRIAKYMEREANNDSYTRDLEEKMEGASTEEDRKDTLINELRKELARVRDSEGNAEEYISTLEERLAEAEQDQEMMQREIDRLEHVVERQRSIGRLDNLLGELDGMRESPRNGRASSHSPAPAATTNGHGHDDDYDPFRENSSVKADDKTVKEDSQSLSVSGEELRKTISAESARTPAQDDFVAEKLESLTQEFFDLRSEHENVLTDYDNLQQKYRTALETLAKLEYGKEPEAKAQPEAESTAPSSRSSFLAEAGMKDEDKATDGQLSSSRSSHSELSSQPALNGAAADEKVKQASGEETQPNPTTDEHQQVLLEMETLKKLHAEKEVSVAELTKNYMSLAQRHEATLNQVEELKQELVNSKRSSSPSFSPSPSFGSSPGLPPPKGSWRRRSEEILGSNSDRASRSYVSLRTMALNNFEDQADVRHTFEQHLHTVMTELHSRSERVQTLESEIVTLRKDMEQKQTIITGLTRERSSLAAVSASGVDFSVVGQMREQLMESENKIRALYEEHAGREKELQDEVERLKTIIEDHQASAAAPLPTPSEVPGQFPVTPALEVASRLEVPTGQATEGAARSNRNDEVERLQKEVVAWESKHREAVDNMTASQNELMKTIAELQASLDQARESGRSVPGEEKTDSDELLEQERMKHHAVVETLETQVREHKSLTEEHAERIEQLQQERSKQQALVETLETQAEEYKSAADESAERLQHLQQQHTDLQKQLDSDSEAKEFAQRQLTQHEDLVANLENQLQVQKSAITIHQESLESLQAAHTKEVEEHTAQYMELQQKHDSVTADLERQVTEAKGEVSSLLRIASSALGYATNPEQLHGHISGLVEEGKELHSRHLKTTNELKAVQEQLQTATSRSIDLENEVEELKKSSEEKTKKLEEVTDKYNKASALVDQLEEQLNSTYDQHQATNKRLSNMQSETTEARSALERELEEARTRSIHLEQQLNAFKHLSSNSNSSSNWNRDSLSPDAAGHVLGRQGSSSSTQRKSGPATLPTPPPSIPLPPLPGSPSPSATDGNTLDRTISPTPRNHSPNNNSPPTSRHASHEVSPSPAVSQLIEDQEARIRTIEKHLFAEKQLTATLEEALVDLETSANRTKSEMENWRKKCQSLEDELVSLRKERSSSRASIQAVEEEREMRLRAERARQALEQRMAELNTNKKKKKGGLNCF